MLIKIPSQRNQLTIGSCYVPVLFSLLTLVPTLNFGQANQAVPQGNQASGSSTGANNPVTKNNAGESTGKNFEVITFNSNNHIFDTDLPFDVPFVIAGSTDKVYSEVKGYVRGFRKTKNFHTEQNGCNALLATNDRSAWQTLLPDKDVADSNFALLSPELKPNRYYRYCIVYTDQSKPSPEKAKELAEELTEALLNVIRKSKLVEGELTITDQTTKDFHKELKAEAESIFQNYSAPPNSVFHPQTSLEVIKAKLLDDMLEKFFNFRGSVDAFDVNKNTSNAQRAKEVLTTKIFTRYDKLISNITTGGFTTGKEQFVYLRNINPKASAQGGNIISNALLGYSGFDITKISEELENKDFYSVVIYADPLSTQLKTNFAKTETVLKGIASFLSTLSTTKTEREKLANFITLAAGTSAEQVDAKNKASIDSMVADVNMAAGLFEAMKNNVDQLLNDGAEARKSLEDLQENLEQLILKEIVVEISGSSYAEFKTRANLYVGADVGMAYMFGNYGLSPYIGTNIYMRPVNKQAPLTGLMFFRRFSFLIGLNLPFFGNTASTNDPKNLFNNKPSLLTGGGFRLSHSLRINGGYSWMRDDSDYFDSPGVKWTPFVAISFDINVATVLNQLMPATLRSSLLSPHIPQPTTAAADKK